MSKENESWMKKTYVNKIDAVCTATGSLVSISCNARQIFMCVCVFTFFLSLFESSKSYHCTKRSTFPTIKWLFWGIRKKCSEHLKKCSRGTEYTHTQAHPILYNPFSLKIVISLTYIHTHNHALALARTHTHKSIHKHQLKWFSGWLTIVIIRE